MVSAYPNLRRRFINTDGIVSVGKSHLLPDLLSKHPEDYVDINTHKVMERVKPWAELPSSIARQTFGIMDSTEMRKRQRKYGFTSLQSIVIDKILVLLVDFDDKPAQIPIETIYSRFFGDYQNSLKEYFKEVSYSRYIPHGDVHGWYRAPNPSTFYTNKENGFGKYPQSSERLIEDVIEIALKDPDIDWTSFDQNDNGYIDNIIVVHSGSEAAWTGDINDFWAHVWIIPQPKIIQGRTVWVYALVSEYLDTPENYRLVGIDCHEFGHLLGLPDLYDYSDNSSGVGFYSLMGSGSWVLKGSSGVHLDAWSKYVLGFADAIEDPTGPQYIDNAEASSTIFKYTTADPKEYFLVENRQKIFFDKYLPSEGLLIWRIDENQIDNQMYNNDKSCYLVGLVQADNFKDLENRANNGDPGDAYGISNKEFGRFTNPSSLLCNGSLLDILISNISDPGSTMSFESLIPGPLQPSPVSQVAQAGLSPAQVIILTGLATGAIYEVSKKK